MDRALAGERESIREYRLGIEEQSRQSPIPPEAFAFVYLGLGDNRRAADQLWQASDARTIRVPWLRVEPLYKPLRQNSRWADLLRHANLQ